MQAKKTALRRAVFFYGSDRTEYPLLRGFTENTRTVS